MTAPLATDAVAVGLTAVATLVIVGLAGAVSYLPKAVRELRQEAEGLAREAEQLLGELNVTVHQEGLEVARVDRLLGSAEAISGAVGSASRPVGGAVTAPFIKVVAFGTGVARGPRLLRRRPVINSAASRNDRQPRPRPKTGGPAARPPGSSPA
jgi:hypothetical protein